MSMIPPIRPQQPLSDEEQAAAALAAIEQQIQGLGPETPQSMGPPGFLERLFTSGAGEPSFTPMGFGSGLLQGLAGGLASRGQKVAQKRQQVEALIEQQRQSKGQQQLKDLEARRAAALKELSDVRGESRKAAAEQRKEAESTTTVTPEMARKNPGLASLVGKKISNSTIASAAFRPDAPYVIMGPNGPIIVPSQSSFGGAPPPKAPTEAQARTTFFKGRADEANALATAGGLEARIVKKAFGTKGPNILKDADQRAYTNAKEAWELAVNRLESGANIAPTEFSKVESTYWVVPGDTDEDRVTKAALRASYTKLLSSMQAPGQQGAGAEEVGTTFNPASAWEP
jgi:hypothetical protein